MRTCANQDMGRVSRILALKGRSLFAYINIIIINATSIIIYHYYFCNYPPLLLSPPPLSTSVTLLLFAPHLHVPLPLNLKNKTRNVK